jgi:cytochrome c-type biogenesis protein CcmH
MTRYQLYMLLIGMFAIGISAVMTPLVGTANAITAEEMLADPVLENRARNLSRKLRCLVCQNQSIDDSDADLAKDLRREVRAQLVQGKTDEAILSDLRAKYGDFVLLAPPLAKNTMALWLAPICFLLLGIGIALGVRRRASAKAPSPISQAERVQIEALKQQHKTARKFDKS